MSGEDDGLSRKDMVLTAVAAVVLIGGMFFFASTNEPPDRVGEARSGARMALEAARSALAGGDGLYIDAAQLWGNLTDDDAQEELFLLSVQAAAAYARGHIEGSVNVRMETLFRDYSLEKLPNPQEGSVVVYCEDGHNSSRAAAFLMAFGYDVRVLRWGLCSWSANAAADGAGLTWTPPDGGYPLVAGVGPARTGVVVSRRSGCGVEDEEVIDPDDVEALERENLRRYIDDILHTDLPAGVSAADLASALEDDGDAADPCVLSVRNGIPYEAGHIPGAVRVDERGLLDGSTLSGIPDGEVAVVVVSNTGQRASWAAALLTMAGREAYALKGGMAAWTGDDAAAPLRFEPGRDAGDYPLAV